jgi:heterodisulfide reductase subunit A-like polyferredoxin
MPEPCKQEGPIAALKADNNNLSAALLEIREGQREFIALLKDISAQGEQIRTLFQRMTKSENDINIIYGRVREVELAPGKQASSLQVYGVSTIIAAVVGYASKKLGG